MKVDIKERWEIIIKKFIRKEVTIKGRNEIVRLENEVVISENVTLNVQGQPYDKFQITITTTIIILTISSILYLHIKLCRLHIMYICRILAAILHYWRRRLCGIFQSLWTLVRPCLLSSFGISNEILSLFHLSSYYYKLFFFFFFFVPLFSSLLLLCFTFSIQQNDSLFFLLISLLLFFFLFSDTFSFFGFTCLSSKKPTYFCVSPSLPPPPPTKPSIGKKGCVVCFFWRVWTRLFVLISFCLRTIWNWKGAKKSWDTFKEKGEIWLTWIGLHYLNAQCSQLPHFILFLKKSTNA
jgi:hypothetical protein